MYSFQSDLHTGEKRCWPCTVTNVVLASVIASGLYVFSPLLAGAFFGAGMLLIAFVGYLVPGTPYLTQRFFPERVLAWFGKVPPDTSGQTTYDHKADRDLDGDVDRLLTVGALSEADEDTLTVTPSFKERWWQHIRALREDERAQRETFAGIVGVDTDEVNFEPVEETGAFAVRVGQNDVSQWMSQAAFVADLAAAEALSAIDSDWSTLSLQDQHRLLMGLRQFLTRCPGCESPLVEEDEATESCCWSISAVTSRCDGCGERLYVVA